MPTQVTEVPAVLDASNEEFDLMIGDLEKEIPEILDLANSHIGTIPKSCSNCTCTTVYCS